MMTLAAAEEAGVKVAAALGAKSLADLRAISAEQLQKDGRGTRPMVDGWYIREDLVGHLRRGTAEGCRRAGRIEQGRRDVRVLRTRPRQRGAVRQERACPLRRSRGHVPEAVSRRVGRREQGVRADRIPGRAQRGRCAPGRRCKPGAGSRRPTSTISPTSLRSPPASRIAAPRTRRRSRTCSTFPGRLWTDVDKALADTMSSYWVNFAATGDPNGKGLPVWRQYRDKSSGRAMVLGDTVAPEPAADSAAARAVRRAVREAAGCEDALTTRIWKSGGQRSHEITKSRKQDVSVCFVSFVRGSSLPYERVTPLDNPAWSALTTHQAHLALGGRPRTPVSAAAGADRRHRAA